MKNAGFAALCIMIFLLIPVSASALDNDKVLHFGVSVALGGAGETWLHHNTGLREPERILYGGLLGIVPGVLKEIIDAGQSDNHFSGSDLVADATGAFVGSLVANLINNRLGVNVEKRDTGTRVSLSYRF